MDHIRISGNECPIKLKPKLLQKGWWKTHKITISINFSTEKFDALKLYESTEVDRRTWLQVPSGTLLSTSSDTHQVVEGFFYCMQQYIWIIVKRKPYTWIPYLEISICKHLLRQRRIIYLFNVYLWDIILPFLNISRYLCSNAYIPS